MNWLKELYNWVLSWSKSPYGTWALLLLAFAESSFFPVPPDVLLIALALGLPKRAFIFAAVCSLGSICGGAFGYLLGWGFWNIAEPVLKLYGWYDKIEIVGNYYHQYAGWAVGIAGFTPIPYKVFTIAAGYFRIEFNTFMLATIISRSARFFLVGGLIYFLGERVKKFIDRYFNALTVIFIVLLVAGFIVLKYI